MTGGGIVQALPMLGDEPFVLLNGDILTDFPFSSLPCQLDTNTLAHLLLTTKPQNREKAATSSSTMVVWSVAATTGFTAVLR